MALREAQVVQAENQRMRKALTAISCPKVTINRLWWQKLARAALLGEKP